MRTPDESGEEDNCYGNNVASPAMMGMSEHAGMMNGHADWKTDVAEFVPTVSGFQNQMHMNGSGCDGCFAGSGMMIAGFGGDAMGGGLVAMPAGVQALVAANGQQGQWIMPVPMAGAAGAMMQQQPNLDMKEAQSLRVEFEWQVRQQEEARIALMARMEELEHTRSEMKDRWERERKALASEICSYKALLTRYAIPLAEVKECGNESLDQVQDQGQGPPTNEQGQQEHHLDQQQLHQMQQLQQLQQQMQQMQPMQQMQQMQQMTPMQQIQQMQQMQAQQEQTNGWENGHADTQELQTNGNTEDDSIDAKLRKLNGLLEQDHSGRKPQAGEKKEGEEGGEDGLGAKSIASTLQAMFPHATVRTRGNQGDGQDNGDQRRGANGRNGGTSDREVGSMTDAVVRRMAYGLEAQTGSEIDDRAMASLRMLPVRHALEALQKVDDLVQAQGGQCRNLSSILQSVCRKLERWHVGEGDLGAQSIKRDPRNFHGSNGYEGPVARTTVKEDVDPDADLKTEKKGDGDPSGEWTAARIERLAEKYVELKADADKCRLKISLGSVEPPLLETGMELFCTWLQKKLAAFKNENGQSCLRRCAGDVDFSNNNLSDGAIWKLLECLAQFEVQAASLKLYRNKISEAGILAICEFIRNNKKAGPVHEMHLSHNEIDDESALELLRTLQESKSRYPPRLVEEGKDGAHLVPVCVRLNQNKIADPQAVLRSLQTEGVTYTLSSSADGSGPGWCSRKECPLVHLHLFTDQMLTSKVANAGLQEQMS